MIEQLADKYASYTMIAREQFIQNLELVQSVEVPGAVVECGTWRGGMLAAMCELRPDSWCVGFDSFEGLPQAQDIDGEAAKAWQANKESPIYFNNCTASLREFRDTMMLTGSLNYDPVKGWFEDTVPKWSEDHPDVKIAILRLDGDWYESTRICLSHLFSKVVSGGLMIVDDYYAWQGCQRAVDEFLAAHPKLQLETIKQVPFIRVK